MVLNFFFHMKSSKSCVYFHSWLISIWTSHVPSDQRLPMAWGGQYRLKGKNQTPYHDPAFGGWARSGPKSHVSYVPLSVSAALSHLQLIQPLILLVASNTFSKPCICGQDFLSLYSVFHLASPLRVPQ